MTIYLAIVLTIGLALLYDLLKAPDQQLFRLGLTIERLTHRKLFHVLALVLYTPMHATLLNDRKMFEYLALAQNFVTVLFIYIELLRYNS